MDDRDRSASTAVNKHKGLQQFFRWLLVDEEGQGVVGSNPARPGPGAQVRTPARIDALGHVANLVNDRVARLLAATAPLLRQQYTVIGVWHEDEPIPVGVIAGEQPVHDGDARAFPHGLWATSVTAPDSTTAQQLAVAEMRES